MQKELTVIYTLAVTDHLLVNDETQLPPDYIVAEYARHAFMADKVDILKKQVFIHDLSTEVVETPDE